MFYLDITTSNDGHNKLVSEIAISEVHSAIVKGYKVYFTAPLIPLAPELPKITKLRNIRLFCMDKSILDEISTVFTGIAITRVKEYMPSVHDRFFSFSNKRLLTPSRLSYMQKRLVNKGIGPKKATPVTDAGLVFIHAYSQSNGTRVPLNIAINEYKELCLSGNINSYGLATRQEGNIVALPVF